MPPCNSMFYLLLNISAAGKPRPWNWTKPEFWLTLHCDSEYPLTPPTLFFFWSARTISYIRLDSWLVRLKLAVDIATKFPNYLGNLTLCLSVTWLLPCDLLAFLPHSEQFQSKQARRREQNRVMVRNNMKFQQREAEKCASFKNCRLFWPANGFTSPGFVTSAPLARHKHSPTDRPGAW